MKGNTSTPSPASEQKKTVSTAHRVLTIIGIVLCVILIPILIINCTLLIKSWTSDDKEVPSIGGIFPMIVETDSMKGTFSGGDLIICKSIEPEDVKVKDVITFFDPASKKNAILTHRVVETFTEDDILYFVTAGDANLGADGKPIIDDIAVPASELVGVYTGFRLPGMGSVAMFMQTIWGLVLCVILPLLLLIGYDAFRRYTYNKKHDGEKEALLKELEELRKLKAGEPEVLNSENQEPKE